MYPAVAEDTWQGLEQKLRSEHRRKEYEDRVFDETWDFINVNVYRQ